MSWTAKIGHPNEVREKGQKISCQSPQRRAGKGGSGSLLGLQAAQGRPVGDRHPGPLRVGRRGRGQGHQAHQLRASSSSPGARPGRAPATSRSWPTTRSIAPRRSSTSAIEIEVKVLRVDRGERKIGLSRKKAHWTKGEGEEEGGEPASAGARRFKADAQPESREQRAASAAVAPCSASAARPRPNPEAEPETETETRRVNRVVRNRPIPRGGEINSPGAFAFHPGRHGRPRNRPYPSTPHVTSNPQNCHLSHTTRAS